MSLSQLENVDIDAVRTGITKFVKILNLMCKEKLRAREKEEHGNTLSELYIQYKAYIFGGVCPEFSILDISLFLCKLSIKDCDDAKALKRGTPKLNVFEIFMSFLKDICEVERAGLIEEHEIPLLNMATKLLEHDHVKNSNLEGYVIDILCKFSTTSDFSSLNSDGLTDFWFYVWNRVSSSPESATTVSKYFKLGDWMARTLSKTTLSINWRKCISFALESMFKSKIYKRMSDSRLLAASLIEFLTTIINVWGLEIREPLIQKLTPILNEFSCSSRLTIDEADSAGIKPLWNFTNLFLCLALPDVNHTSICDSSLLSCCRVIYNQNLKMLARICSHRSTFNLSEIQVKTIARCLVLDELNPSFRDEMSTTVLDTQSSQYFQKRSRISSPIELITHGDLTVDDKNKASNSSALLANCFRILSEITVNFKRYFSSHALKKFAIEVWNMKTFCSDANKSNHCMVLKQLVDAGAFGDYQEVKSESLTNSNPMEDPRVRVKNIWLYALSCSNVNDALDNSMELMSSLLKHFVALLGSTETLSTNIFGVLAKTASTATLDLLSTFLVTVDFDEISSFSGAIDMSTGISSWRLRCHLSEWLIKKFSSNIASELILLSSMHPEVVSQSNSFVTLRTISQEEGLITDLDKLAIPETKPKLEKKLIPNPFIVDVLEYIINILQDKWCNCENEIRPMLWNTIIHFVTEIGFREPSSFSLCGALVQSINEWLYDACLNESTSDLMMLKPYYGIVHISREVLAEVKKRAAEQPTLFATFSLDVSHVPPSFLVSILNEVVLTDFKIESSSFFFGLMNRLEKFSSQVDFLPDILLIISKYGHYISERTRNILFNRALAIYLEDKASNSQSDNMIELSRLELVQLGIISRWPKVFEVLEVDDFQKKSIAKDIIVNIDSCDIPQTCSRVLIDVTINSCLLLRKMVWYILRNGYAWADHMDILTIIIKSAELTQMMMEYMSSFEDVFNFYAFSLANLGIVLPRENFFHSRYISFASNAVVKKKDNMDITCFPQALQLHFKSWASVMPLFWNCFDDYPQEMIISLKKTAVLHMKLNMEKRLIVLLEALTMNFYKITLSSLSKVAFQATTRSIIVSLVKSAVSKQNTDLLEILKGVLVVDKQLFENENSLTLLLCSDLIDEDHPQFSFFSSHKESLNSLCKKEVKLFLSQNQHKHTCLFLTCTFWKCLHEEMRNDYMSNNFVQNSVSEKINAILTLWEIAPSIRKFIAPILYVFGNSKNQLMRIEYLSKSPTKSFVYLLRFICEIVLLDPERYETEWVAFAISVLSCESIGLKHFLSRLKREIKVPSVTTRSTGVIMDFSKAILEISDKAWKSSPMEPVIGLCEKYLPYMKPLASLLCPVMCGSPSRESRQAYASLLLKFSSRLEVFDKPDEELLRLIRTLCECLDCIGIDIMESVQNPADDFVKMGNLACSAGFYDHAYVLANLAFDRHLGKERSLVALEMRTIDYQNLYKLLLEIYIATGNVPAMDSLPGWAQNDPRVQQMRMKDSCRWLRVASDNLSTAEEVVFAKWFCGAESAPPNSDVTYLNALLHQNVTETSYPKTLTSHWKRIYSVLTLRGLGHDLFPHITELLVSDLMQSNIIDIKICKQLMDFFLLTQQYEFIFSDQCTVEQQCLAVVFGFYCVSSSSTEDRMMYIQMEHRMVLEIVRKFIELQAHSAGLSILSNWLKIFPSDIRSHQILVEQCKVQVAMGDFYIAQYKLTEMAKDTLSTTVAVEVMCLLSNIFAENQKNLDQGIKVMKELVDSIPSGSKPSSYATAYRQLYKLSVRKLFDLEGLMESSATQLRRQAVEEWKRQLDSSSSQLDKKQRIIVQKELKCEEEELFRLDISLKQTVALTIASGLNLLKSVSPPDPEGYLEDSSEIIEILFPLLDIIFRYENLREVVDCLRKYVVNFSPFVWLPALAHIISHCFKEDPLSTVIQDITVSLIVAYPYHVLHTVLAYKYDAEKLSKHAETVRKMLALAEKKAKNPVQLRSVIKDISHAHNVYRIFNWLKMTDSEHFLPLPSQNGKVQFRLDPKVALLKDLETLTKLPLPTLLQPVGRAGDYSTNNFIKWLEINPVIDKADGLSAPKILRVKGSDNNWYKMVWKKGEDVRQDSLVEHLFEVVNVLIGTRQPLRTYKVIPLDSQCGIIEFCAGTRSLKEILVGPNLKTGLHNEIYPEESLLSARMQLLDAAKSERRHPTTDEYRSILRSVTPVFRHHFYQKFTTTKEWKRMIENYTQSLAEWSIVCYVIGLGDRHASNVLFDDRSCNLVHIDLGMILEFGRRVLHIPERVPFRMTRDILDPILIQNTSGNLLNRATFTMEKIRKHKEVILGVASVFLRETMSNFRDSSDGSRPSFVSATAVKRLKDKLDGTDSSVSPVSSYIQIQRLMAEATNMDNLSKLFAGWLSFV